jgi:hypothetical protein
MVGSSQFQSGPILIGPSLVSSYRLFNLVFWLVSTCSWFDPQPVLVLITFLRIALLLLVASLVNIIAQEELIQYMFLVFIMMIVLDYTTLLNYIL